VFFARVGMVNCRILSPTYARNIETHPKARSDTMKPGNCTISLAAAIKGKPWLGADWRRDLFLEILEELRQQLRFGLWAMS
jgi:hypothetical protein